jgi:hypothetical protein
VATCQTPRLTGSDGCPKNAPKTWSESGLAEWLGWVGFHGLVVVVRLLCCADAVRQLVLHTTTRSLHSRGRPFLRCLVEGGR